MIVRMRAQLREIDADGSGTLDAGEVAQIFKDSSPVALPVGADEEILKSIEGTYGRAFAPHERHVMSL